MPCARAAVGPQPSEPEPPTHPKQCSLPSSVPANCAHQIILREWSAQRTLFCCCGCQYHVVELRDAPPSRCRPQ